MRFDDFCVTPSYRRSRHSAPSSQLPIRPYAYRTPQMTLTTLFQCTESSLKIKRKRNPCTTIVVPSPSKNHQRQPKRVNDFAGHFSRNGKMTAWSVGERTHVCACLPDDQRSKLKRMVERRNPSGTLSVSKHNRPMTRPRE